MAALRFERGHVVAPGTNSVPKGRQNPHQVPDASGITFDPVPFEKRQQFLFHRFVIIVRSLAVHLSDGIFASAVPTGLGVLGVAWTPG